MKIKKKPTENKKENCISPSTKVELTLQSRSIGGASRWTRINPLKSTENQGGDCD